MPPPPPVTSLLSTSGLQSTQKVLAVPQSDASLDSPIEKPLTVAVDTSKPLSTPRRLSFVVSASLSSSWTEARSFLTSSAKTPSGKPPSETSSVDNQPIADLQVENENSPGEIPISICDPNPMSEKVLMLVFSDEESSGDIYWDSWLDIEKFMSDVRAEAAERVKIGNSTYASNGFCQYLDWLGKGFEVRKRIHANMCSSLNAIVVFGMNRLTLFKFIQDVFFCAVSKIHFLPFFEE
eukprot:TRINITY_DN2261_c0_g1_i1.p1 TRINITY_DN2261_c0_g1~~TRINITY_DN2261_c0_g1_i1.p1  ORF type:complete len:237 (+),score=38.82 TRINITY_DN2261_c0_g1_i1:720-1430(+)